MNAVDMSAPCFLVFSYILSCSFRVRGLNLDCSFHLACYDTDQGIEMKME
jgi:hypothetical protein